MAENDFVTKATNFIDENLRIIRASTWLVAGAGVFIIMKNIHMFKWFRRVSDIPQEFITKGIELRGTLKSIADDNTLAVLNKPIIKTSQYKMHDKDSPDNHLLLSLAGVEFREGSNQWLTANLTSSYIRFNPVQIVKNGQCLSCIVYKKRKYFPIKVCINEEIVRQGFAVTSSSLVSDEMKNKKLFSRLLKAEAFAQMKGRGIWAKTTLSQRIRSYVVLPSFLDWRKKR